MKISVIGTGYVGLVVGTCFADVGNDVMCADIDTKKIDALNNKKIPIYEPGLEELVRKNLLKKKLIFTSNVARAIKWSDVCFITVDTPSLHDGSANLEYLFNVAEMISKNINGYKIIINKSTAPVGSTELIEKVIRKRYNGKFDIISNPEFLKQGKAVADFFNPDRTIIGLKNEKIMNNLIALFSPFYRISERIIFMDIKSAELTKYAANSFLAMKISFINEIAMLSEKLGVDINCVRKGLSMDNRIGAKFLFPGIGYGGSCFPKDTKALIKMGADNGIDMKIVKAVEAVNNDISTFFTKKILKKFNSRLEKKHFVIWGLSFKPNTNDMRDSPSIKIINFLLKRNAKVFAYDPKAFASAKKIFKNRITICKNQYDNFNNADALIILTEWNEFRKIDFTYLSKTMNKRMIFDGRNQFNRKSIPSNFEYFSI